uniref:SHSP domain-containing protein n=1 Tax=Strongyloides venezuelensis TaxID=75913 RepID=A0A0K0F866_STRVS
MNKHPQNHISSYIGRPIRNSLSTTYSLQSKNSGIAKYHDTYHSPYANYDCKFIRGIIPSKKETYICDWPYNQKNNGSVIAVTNGRCIELSFDVRQFKPKEIKIYVDGERLNIFCKHEKNKESNNCGTYISKTYHLPKYINPKTLTHEITQEGDLIIRVSKKFL